MCRTRGQTELVGLPLGFLPDSLYFFSFLPVYLCHIHLCLFQNLQQLFFSFLKTKKGTMQKYKFKRHPDTFKLPKIHPICKQLLEPGFLWKH